MEQLIIGKFLDKNSKSKFTAVHTKKHVAEGVLRRSFINLVQDMGEWSASRVGCFATWNKDPVLVQKAECGE